MRRIDESIESLTPVANDGTAPLAFRWRGRRYVVGAVLAHWVETGAWWRRTAQRPTPGSDELPDSVPDPERWLWRVEACRGAQTGVFDLCLEVGDRPGDHTDAPAGDRGSERWSLYAIYD